MQLFIRANFCTDGDFWVRDIDDLFDPKNSMYRGANIQYQFREDKDLEEFCFSLSCDGNHMACQWAARDLLEALAVSFSVDQTHYWLVKELYELVITPKETLLFGRDNVDRFWTLGGNYDGTELSLYIKH